MFETNFSTIDWVIVALYLGGTVLVGMYVNRHIHSSADYLVGGRAAGTALSVATLVGTELGLVTLMYAAMEGFNRGLAYLAIPLLGWIVPLILGATGFVIGPMRKLNLTTVPEFFERRFNRRTRIVGGVICALAGILNMGLFPKMGATFITYAVGWGGNDDVGLLINGITSALIVFVLIYTIMGGMVAVIVTDYLQFVVLSLGLAIGLYFCLLGDEIGWTTMVTALKTRGGEAAFNPFHAESYGGAYMSWQIVLIFSAGICWAPTVSRALTTQDVATTRRTFFIGSPGFFTRMAVPGLWGMAAWVYFAYGGRLDGYFSPQSLVDSPDRASHAMPLLMGQLLPPVVLGVLMAGLLAAFMSTHDSYLLAWATVISQDIVGPLRGNPLTNAQSISATRWGVLGIGLFLLAFGVWIDLPASVWTYMSITGTIYLSGAATVLIGGLYWRRASSTGALLALSGGLLALAALFESPLREAAQTVASVPEEVAGTWISGGNIALATYGLCLLLFVGGSLAFPDPPKNAESAA